MFLYTYIRDELKKPMHKISESLQWLAHGPKFNVKSFYSFTINGSRFTTQARDKVRVNQNSGVKMVAQTMQFASSKDGNPVLSNITYYGIIQEIWELDYEVFNETIFLCD